MQYIHTIASPLGRILLAADEVGLTGLWFEGQTYFAHGLNPVHTEQNRPVFEAAARWLDVYFSGREPTEPVALHPTGSDFQVSVWRILCTIPYGQTTTYGAIARQLAAQRGLPHLSAQAVGGAVGRNAISILIPCHRVIGANGSLTGYAGGLDRKRRLLQLEHANLSGRFVPGGAYA